MLKRIYMQKYISQSFTVKQRNGENYLTHEIKIQFRKFDVVKKITKRRVMCAGDACHKQESLVGQVIEEPIGK